MSLPQIPPPSKRVFMKALHDQKGPYVFWGSFFTPLMAVFILFPLVSTNDFLRLVVSLGASLLIGGMFVVIGSRKLRRQWFDTSSAKVDDLSSFAPPQKPRLRHCIWTEWRELPKARWLLYLIFFSAVVLLVEGKLPHPTFSTVFWTACFVLYVQLGFIVLKGVSEHGEAMNRYREQYGDDE